MGGAYPVGPSTGPQLSGPLGQQGGPGYPGGNQYGFDFSNVRNLQPPEPPGAGQPSPYGGDIPIRDRITQALLQVQNPPPMTEMPPPPAPPQNFGGASPMAVPQAAATTPGAPGAAGQPSPYLSPSPMGSAGASNPMLPSTMPGGSQLAAQQAAANAVPRQY